MGEGVGGGREAGLLQRPSLILLHPSVGGASRSITVSVTRGAGVGVGYGWEMVGGLSGDGRGMVGDGRGTTL